MSDEGDASIQHRIDQICDRYETALKSGQSPEVDAIIAEVNETHREQLRQELLALKADYEKSRSGFDLTVDGDQTIDSHVSPRSSPAVMGEKLKYFGNYEIIDEIARGGMGVVYRARQTTLGRIVALKMILAGELAGEHEIARFQSEAEAAANLDHPGIVPIYEVGRYNDHHYFSMGLIEGPSLSEVLRDGPLEPRRAAECLRKIADAVAYANAKGVIHRDLKPGNILLDRDGDPHITDFGLAKRLEADKELTTTGEVLGTPAYMPPEQARGDLAAIGSHSDVYALGAILYAMLSGRPPHAAPSMMETLRQVIEVDAVSVRSLNPSTPKDLETICAKCLSKEPSKRYAKANELSDELGRYLAGEPILARPVSRAERAWRWSRRRPALASLVATLLLLTIALAVGGPMVAITQSRLKQIAQDNEQRATLLAASEREAKEQVQASRADLSAAKDRSDTALYARTVSLAMGQWQAGNLTNAEDMLASLPASDRGFEWHYVNSLCHSELASFADMRAFARAVEIAPDGVHVIAIGHGGAGGDERTYVWQVDGGGSVTIRDGRGIAFSANGGTLAIGSRGEPNKFQLVDSITGDIEREFSGHENLVQYAAIGGPDDSIVATSASDSSVRLWDRASGKQTLKIDQPHRKRLSPIALAPNGQFVAWRRSDDGAIEVRDTAKGFHRYEGPAVRSLANHDTPVAFSPDSSLLAVGGKAQIELLDPRTGDSQGTLIGMRGFVIAINFSPTGDRIAATCQDGMVRIFDMTERRLLTTMTGHQTGSSYGVVAVAFDGSGDRIATSGYDMAVKVWDAWNGDRDSIAKSTRPKIELPQPNQAADFITPVRKGVETLTFTDDGEVMVVAGWDQSIRCIDAATGDVLQEWTEVGENLGAVDYHRATGRVIAGGGGIQDTRPGVVIAWDFDSRDELWRFDQAVGPISAIKIFDDGRKVAVAIGSQNTNTGGLFVLDANSGACLWNQQDKVISIRDMDVSADGKSIATVGTGLGIKIWDAASGNATDKIGDRVFFAVAFSKDSQRIATGGVDWSVRVFGFPSGDEQWNQIRHGGAVMDLAFAAGDTRLVSTSLDGETRIWETQYGESILQLRDSDRENLTVAVSPAADLIAVSGFEPTVVLRRCTPVGENLAAGALAPIEDWITIIEDDFERDSLGDDWHAVPETWTIQSGELVGTLAANPFLSGINAANITHKSIVPANVEISYDATLIDPMVVETKVLDRFQSNSISALFVGIAPSPFNHGEKGVAIVQMLRGDYRVVASRREGSFAFDIGRKYRLTTVRRRDHVELLIDGETYRTVDVPLDAPTPLVNIQGIFGAAGARVRIDNVLVRVPPDCIGEIRAQTIVNDFFDARMIRPLVIAAIRDAGTELFGDQPAQTRRMAIELAQSWPQTDDAILTEIERLATDGKSEPETYRTLLDWIENEIKEKGERHYRAAAMVAQRLDDSGATWEAMKQAKRLHRSSHGTSHPVDAAIETLRYLANKNTPLADQRRDEIHQLMLADHYANDELAKQWTAIAEQAFAQSKPDAKDQPTEKATISQTLTESTWNLQHALMIHGDVGALDRALAEQATREIRRVSGDDPHMILVDRANWVESDRIWAMGGPSAQGRLTRHQVTVNTAATTPTVSSWFVAGFPAGYYEWVQTDVFEPKPDVAPEQWKIVKQVNRLVKLSIQGETFDVGRDGWQALDAKVTQAKTAGDQVGEMRWLFLAGRLTEAIDAAVAFAKQENTAFAFVRLAEMAHRAGDADLLRKSAEKAIELDPMVSCPPAFRAVAAKALAAKEPLSLKQGIRVSPPSFFRRANDGFLAAGENGIAAWQPTDSSLVGIVLVTVAAETSLEKTVDGVVNGRAASLKAELLMRRERTIDGRAAIEFVQKGLGLGRAMSLSGQPTLQRLVVCQHDSDQYLIFLVSAYEHEFEMRNAEFEQFLMTVKLRP